MRRHSREFLDRVARNGKVVAETVDEANDGPPSNVAATEDEPRGNATQQQEKEDATD